MSLNAHSGIFTAHAQNVAREDRDGRPVNTKRVYDLKEAEWYKYCEHLFASGKMAGPRVTYTVNEDRFFGFLYYQSRRNKKKRGRRGVPAEGFNGQEFDFSAIFFKLNLSIFEHLISYVIAISVIICNQLIKIKLSQKKTPLVCTRGVYI